VIIQNGHVRNAEAGNSGNNYEDYQNGLIQTRLRGKALQIPQNTTYHMQSAVLLRRVQVPRVVGYLTAGKDLHNVALQRMISGSMPDNALARVGSDTAPLPTLPPPYHAGTLRGNGIEKKVKEDGK
jgi:hypothetical protein